MLMYAKTFREARMGGRASKKSTKQEYWQQHITAWRSSGLSQRQYCAREGLAVQTFGYWQRKLKQETSRPIFYPLTVPAACAVPKEMTEGSGLQVVLCGQRFRIAIDHNFDGETLRQLITALEAM